MVMSTRDDAVLTEAERQAFARLQAQIVSEDRSFGPRRPWQLEARVRAAGKFLAGAVTRTWFGVAVMVLGVLAVAAGLVWNVALGIVGLLLVTAGAVPVIERVRARIDAATSQRRS